MEATSSSNKPPAANLPTATKLSGDVAAIAVQLQHTMGLPTPRAAIEGVVRTCWFLYQSGAYLEPQTSKRHQPKKEKEAA